MHRNQQLYINAKEVLPASGEWFDIDNPYTGEVWAQIPRGNAADVNCAARAAHVALTTGPWPQLTASQRGLLRHKLGSLRARDAATLAAMTEIDNGKSLAEILGQHNDLSQWFYYFAWRATVRALRKPKVKAASEPSGPWRPVLTFRIF